MILYAKQINFMDVNVFQQVKSLFCIYFIIVCVQITNITLIKQGHHKHEYTSGVAIEPVFEFLQFRARGNKEITNQKNETSEQSVTNNNEGKEQ